MSPFVVNIVNEPSKPVSIKSCIPKFPEWHTPRALYISSRLSFLAIEHLFASYQLRHNDIDLARIFAENSLLSILK